MLCVYINPAVSESERAYKVMFLSFAKSIRSAVKMPNNASDFDGNTDGIRLLKSECAICTIYPITFELLY